MPLDRTLFDAGLKLQAAIAITDVAVPLPEAASTYNQLIVLGHGGPDYFEQTPVEGENPLDDRAIRLFQDFMMRIGCAEYEILYPINQTLIDLRTLGVELGWQRDSHLGLGIHPDWGTWFAYRLVAATRTHLPVTPGQRFQSPCETCLEKPCLVACPASATGEVFQMSLCSGERLRPASSCADRCLAREACPVGKTHQYSRAQIEYHARHSFNELKAH